MASTRRLHSPPPRNADASPVLLPPLPTGVNFPSPLNARFGPSVAGLIIHRWRPEQTTSTRDNVFIIRFYPADDSLSVYTTYVLPGT